MSDTVEALLAMVVFTVPLLVGATGFFWVARRLDARRGAMWADVVRAMRYRLEGIRDSAAARFGVPRNAPHPGRLAVGVVGSEPRRASAFLTARTVKSQGKSRRYPETWICVHVGRSLGVGVLDEQQAFLRRQLGFFHHLLPKAFGETVAAIERDPQVEAVLRRFHTVPWTPAILDRRVVAKLDGHLFDAAKLLHAVSVLNELADVVVAARERMAPSTADREHADKWRDVPSRVGLELAHSPPRLVGLRGGRPVEVQVETAYPSGRPSTSIRVSLATPVGAHVAIERGPSLPCAAEYRPIRATDRDGWTVRVWEDHAPAVLSHPALWGALAAAPAAALAFVIEDDSLTLGAFGALDDPAALARALDAALAVAATVESVAATRAPFR